MGGCVRAGAYTAQDVAVAPARKNHTSPAVNTQRDERPAVAAQEVIATRTLRDPQFAKFNEKKPDVWKLVSPSW